MAHDKPKLISFPRLSLGSLSNGIVRSIKFTGNEIKKAGIKLNTIDTTYISPNKYNLAFMLEQSSWYEHYRLGSNDGQSLSFAPHINTKLGVYFGWRWIFLGLSFDIKDLLGKGKNKAPRKEIVFNLYSAKFGVDLYYRKTGSDFKISSYENFRLNKNYTNTQFNGFQSNIKGLNAYWISTTNISPTLQPTASRPTSGKVAVLCWPDSPIHNTTSPSTTPNCPMRCSNNSAPP